MASEQDDSSDSDVSETEPTETSAISEEQESLLREYIKHHSEMKVFLKRSLREGQTEGSSALRDYIKNNKPKKPKTSLDKLFEHKPCTQAESEHTTQAFLKTKLLENEEEQLSADCSSRTHLSGSESWSTIAAEIRNISLCCQRRNRLSLSSHVQLGILLQAGAKLYEDEKLLGRVQGTFDEWIRKKAKMSSRHARKLREIARVIQHYPRLHSLTLFLTEVYQRLANIRKVLEIPEYKEFWTYAT